MIYESHLLEAGLTLPGGHCGSCHEDAAQGYEMCEVDPPEARFTRRHYHVEVCCSASRALDELTEPEQRQLWAKAIRLARKARDHRSRSVFAFNRLNQPPPLVYVHPRAQT